MSMKLYVAVCAALMSLLSLAEEPKADDSQESYLYVLGVAQDAGYPQAGCYQSHCMPGWQDPLLRRGATAIALVDPEARQNIFLKRRRICQSNCMPWSCRRPQNSIH